MRLWPLVAYLSHRKVCATQSIAQSDAARICSDSCCTFRQNEAAYLSGTVAFGGKRWGVAFGELGLKLIGETETVRGRIVECAELALVYVILCGIAHFRKQLDLRNQGQ